jgi:hypothetical protein
MLYSVQVNMAFKKKISTDYAVYAILNEVLIALNNKIKSREFFVILKSFRLCQPLHSSSKARNIWS